MALIPLTDRSEIEQAYQAYEEALHAGGQPRIRSLSWHGGGEDGFELHWHPRLSLWYAHVRSRTATGAPLGPVSLRKA
jgi:hypothetical protein